MSLRRNFLTGAYLLRQLVVRDIQSRYKGTVGGALWVVGQPLLMLAIYTLVFGLVFQPKWDGLGSIWDFSLVLFLGKIPYIYVLDTVGRSPALMVAHAGYVKKTQFPLGFLIWMSQASALFVAVVSLFVWGLFYLLIHFDLPPITSLLLPIIYLPLFFSVGGICYFLSSLGTYFRDVSQIVQPILFSMMFLSPVFYPIHKSPEWMRGFLEWNPMSQAIEQSRNVIYFGQSMDWHWWGMQMLLGILLLILGRGWFSRTRGGFAEVI
ncbi:MAG: transport permease protein [Silanimonas sp.]|jgi:lipopolysaccharide transport system permease protein|nr:MAG: transport permease protein [Silanimonas sp.]